MTVTQDHIPSFWTAFTKQKRVLIAVILRLMRTRFFNHGLGYLVAVGWPLTHILLLIAIFSATGRTAPFGESTILFIATGSVPFMTFSYLSRFMMIDLLSTKPLLSLPEVKLMDVLIASALLEVFSAFTVILIMVFLGWAFDIPFVPQDIVEFFSALGAAVLLGFGMGFLNSVISTAFPIWMTGYSLFLIVVWASSGVMFVPNSVPEPFRTYLSYNPALQVVEWTRASYYEGYGEHLLDRTYAIAFGVGSLILGLVLERIMRARVLSVR